MIRKLAVLPLCCGMWSCSSAPIAPIAPTPAPVNGSISRDGYRWIQQSSGGIDDGGYYRTPQSSKVLFGEDLGTGIYRLSPDWADTPDHRLLLETQNGKVVREDWEFSR